MTLKQNLKKPSGNFPSKIYKVAFFVYQGIFQSNIRTCRYEPTCSKYSLEALQKYGFFKGIVKSFVRITSCQPRSTKPILDPLI